MKKFRIYDNGGKTLDRYTLVIRESDSKILHLWGCGPDPRGMSYYCGSSNEGYCAHSGLGKRLKTVPKEIVAFYAQCVRACGYDYHVSNALDNLT